MGKWVPRSTANAIVIILGWSGSSEMATHEMPQDNLELVPTSLPQKVTWVGCDACGKWRKVSQALAESLDNEDKWYEHNFYASNLTPNFQYNTLFCTCRIGVYSAPKRWCIVFAANISRTSICRYCEQNPDQRHNSCSAPQELSDQEIDLALAPAVRLLLRDCCKANVPDNVANVQLIAHVTRYRQEVELEHAVTFIRTLVHVLCHSRSSTYSNLITTFLISGSFFKDWENFMKRSMMDGDISQTSVLRVPPARSAMPHSFNRLLQSAEWGRSRSEASSTSCVATCHRKHLPPSLTQAGEWRRHHGVPVSASTGWKLWLWGVVP